jgi:hypothetical protein
MQKFAFLAAAAAIAIAAPAAAIEVFEVSGVQAASFEEPQAPQLVRTQSGSKNGFTWMAASRVIGQTPTSDVLPPNNSVGGGNPLYKPSSNKSGVVALIMETNAGNFICSGSLLAGGRHIATAAHCVTDGTGQLNVNRTTVHFFNGDPDQRTVAPGASHTMNVQEYFVHEGYTGEVIDQNDIAILRLSAAAPVEFERYDLHTPTSLTGAVFNVAGYGTRSTVGGAAGNTAPAGARTGYLREGDNRYDYAWGDSRFQGFFTDVFGGENFFGTAEIDKSYISDFDNGLQAQDSARRIANALGLGAIGNTQFPIDFGLGAREVGIAGGDSGGPGFVNGDLASINSYGLTFGFNFGDFDQNVTNPDGSISAVFNAGWGEFSGYVPVYIHQDFIAESTAVPEPASWAMLIAGFGLIGATMRRRRAVAA